MTRTICISIDLLIIIACVLIGITTMYKYNDNISNMSNIIPIQTENTIDNEFLKNRTLLNKRDANVLYDNFSPPERRVPEYMYPSVIKNNINIPTRGLPEKYQLLGLASRNNTETVFNLFGRQTFPGSNQYEYYVESTNNKKREKRLLVKCKFFMFNIL